MMHTLLDMWDRQNSDYFLLATNEPWRDRFVTRNDFPDLARWVRTRVRGGRHVYFCAHGYRRPKKLAEYAAESCLLWADLDARDPRELRERPTIAWRTSRGRYSAIWRCDGEPTRVLRRGFNDHVGADRGWNLTKVLRLPGTLNYKYDPPQPVRWLWDDGPTYKLRDLRKYAVADAGRIAKFSNLNIAGIDVRAVVKRYKFDSDLMDTVIKGKRSDVIWKLGQQLKAAGATRDEIAAAIYASAAWRSKHGPNSHGRLAQEVARVMSKR